MYQCFSEYGDMRCQLPKGHTTAHQRNQHVWSDSHADNNWQTALAWLTMGKNISRRCWESHQCLIPAGDTVESFGISPMPIRGDYTPTLGDMIAIDWYIHE